MQISSSGAIFLQEVAHFLPYASKYETLQSKFKLVTLTNSPMEELVLDLVLRNK